MTEEPLYPFGFGLSYTCFEYSDLQLDKKNHTLGDSLNVSLTLRNNGASDSAEVAQFYLTDTQASSIVPLHHLIGFERVTLKAGESRKIKLTITPEMMSFFNDDGKLTLEPGEFRLEVGGCSPSNRGQDLGAPKPVTAIFEIK
ncbi:fibronectin type III-like domain-contianing protein [Candidatus Villigracilis proximus]|uniref:fibronectin type III-like domain-contianing protein n=1 Tax=Candidatus Villigracilis proximus TaxID=3140683 RepID=UPI0031EC03B1